MGQYPSFHGDVSQWQDVIDRYMRGSTEVDLDADSEIDDEDDDARDDMESFSKWLEAIDETAQLKAEPKSEPPAEPKVEHKPAEHDNPPKSNGIRARPCALCKQVPPACHWDPANGFNVLLA